MVKNPKKILVTLAFIIAIIILVLFVKQNFTSGLKGIKDNSDNIRNSY